MFWFLGRMALRGAGSMLSGPRGPAGPDPYQVDPASEAGRKSAVIGLVIFCGLAGPMCAILYTGYEGHVSLGECESYCIGFWSLLVLLLAVSGLAKRVSRSEVLRRYAAPPEPDTTAQRYRERAAQLRQDTRPLPAVQVPDSRERRVAALFSRTCPACGAPPAVPCAMGIGIPVAIVQKYPLMFCHLVRMQDAVKHGTAEADEVYAQFDNSVPTGLAL